jgi:hypothetical protein
MLRIAYVVATPHDVRAYDWEGHMQYIDYVFRNGSLPPPSAGWEFYQPPLYYIVAAVLLRIASIMGLPSELRFLFLQWFSLLLSLLTLGIGFWIGALLYPAKEHLRERLLFFGVIATFPSLILFAARINNDSLYHVFAFLSFGFLLRWWQTRRPRDWYLLAAAVCLGILTKSNAILLVPVSLLCLLAAELPWKAKIMHGVAMCALVAAALALFLLPRALAGETTTVGVGNINTLNPALRVSAAPSAYVTFNPIEVLRHPYNHTWHDDQRRHNFWEFFYRSAYFGEFSFGDALRAHAQFLLAIGYLLFPLTLFGIWKSIRQWDRRHIPLLLTLGVLLAGHVAFRMQYPYSSSQDFRYSILLIVPLAFYAIEGARHLPKNLRRAAHIVMFLFIAASAGLLLRL